MKKIIVPLILLLLCNCIVAQQKDHDAVIIYNKVEQTYSFSKLENFLYGTEIILKTSRKVKILSAYGLEQFATMYIPTYSDLDFKIEIISLVAQTINATGSVHKISGEAIKETTLPSNVPFFSNYKGKVKALAFENLNVGDEIQYDFQIKYTSSSRSSSFYNSLKEFIPEEYKILEAEYIFHFKNDIQFRGVVINSNTKFNLKENNEKGCNTYVLAMNNIEPYKPEVFSVKENSVPYFIADVFKMADFAPYEKWDDLTKDIQLSSRSSYFFAGKSVSNVYSECKDEITPTKKILKVHEIMMAEMNKSKGNVYSAYTDYQADLEDANQIFKLLKLLDVNGAVLLVKNKLHGVINKDFVSLRQFDDLLVEFDDKGNKHYFALFDPYASLDEINALYQGTEALKIEVANKKETVSFVKVPVINSSNNNAVYNYTIVVSNVDGSTNIDNTLKVEKYGQFFIEDRIGYMIERTLKKYTQFTDEIKGNLKATFQHCKIDTVVLSGNNKQIEYSVEYNFTKYSENAVNMFDMKISDLFYSDLLESDYKAKRNTKAIFPNVYNITRKFVIKAKNGFNVTPNIFLKKTYSNDFGYISTDYTIPEPGTIVVTLNYRIKLTELMPSQWNLFLDFISASKEMISQRILFQK
jgi:hypothetical protein